MEAQRLSASMALRGAVMASESGTVTLGELATALGRRSYHLLILLLALPNCIPAPPGIGSVVGIPLAAVALQLLVGRPVPWLPAFIARKPLDRAKFLAFLSSSEPFIASVERWVRPRGEWLAGTAVDRAAAAFVVVLAVCITLPIPLTNMLPALSATVISISLLERDMAGVIAGFVLGLAGLAVAGAAVASAGTLLFSWLA